MLQNTGKHQHKERSSYRWCSLKKVFLKISQILQENTCVEVKFLINFITKKRLQHSCFPVKVFKNTYFEEHPRTTASNKEEHWCQMVNGIPLKVVLVKPMAFCELLPSLL